ncbi:MAG TPA: hypothetical protein VF192_03260 [Longimicrobiales bacterium]
MLKKRVVLALAGVLPGSALFLSCRDGTGPGSGPLTFPAPIQALLPGMQDTVLAYVGWRQVGPEEGEWTSSDPTVLEVQPGGVVVARSLGEATIRFRLDERRVDSLRIVVVPPPAGRIVFAGYRELTEGAGAAASCGS